MDAEVADTCTTLEPRSAVMGVSSASRPRADIRDSHVTQVIENCNDFER